MIFGRIQGIPNFRILQKDYEKAMIFGHFRGIPNFRDYSGLFGTLRDYSGLFGTIQD